jgi:hypothetical protein
MTSTVNDDIPSGTQLSSKDFNSLSSNNNNKRISIMNQVMNVLPDTETTTYPFVQHAMVLAPPSNKLLTLTKCTRKVEDASLRMIAVVQWVLTNMRNTVKSKASIPQQQELNEGLTQLHSEWHHYPDLYLGSRCNTVANCSVNDHYGNTTKMNVNWHNDRYDISYSAFLDFKLNQKLKRVDHCISGERVLHLGKSLKENYRIQLPVIRESNAFFSNSRSISYSGDLIVECNETAVKAIVSFSSSNINGSIMEQKCNNEDSYVVAQLQGNLESDITVTSLDSNMLPYVETGMNVMDDVRDYYPIFMASISSDV